MADFFEGIETSPPRLVPESFRLAMWMRVKQRLPDDPTIHAAVLAYASDFWLVMTKLNSSVGWDCGFRYLVSLIYPFTYILIFIAYWMHLKEKIS
jgi:hypothetical protein